MAIRVGRIPYRGCEPFDYDMDRRGIELRDMGPTKTASALRNGEIDSAPVPLTDCIRLEDGFQPVSGFCIAAVSNSSTSVLHSKEPITELNGSRIALPDDASTSRSLLRILLNKEKQSHGKHNSDRNSGDDR